MTIVQYRNFIETDTWM